MPKKVIDLGWCPRYKVDFYDSDVNEGEQKEGELPTTRISWGIRWCRFCSIDLKENSRERKSWIRWTKNRAEM